jgi:hypothetical protein
MVRCTFQDTSRLAVEREHILVVVDEQSLFVFSSLSFRVLIFTVRLGMQ